MPNPDAPPLDFYPPKQNPLVTRLFQSISPLVSHFFFQFDFKIATADLEKISALGTERLVFMPNHPSFQDGIVLFRLSARLGTLFHYMIAWENFRGLPGQLLQMGGGYSIRRGVGDRASIAQTLKLLTQPACRLAIFPEGGCSFQNDTVMPFRPGAIQLPLQAMSRLAKQQETIPNFYLIPVSIKYRYTSPMRRTIDATLNRLESTLHLSPTTAEFYPRLRATAERVIVNLEREYNLNVPLTMQTDWNQRIEAIKTHLLQTCEQKLDLPPAPNLPARERVYKIQAALESRTENLEGDKIWTDDSIYKASMRLLNFDAIYDGYVAANPTPERFLDTLMRLEREVYGIVQPPPKGHRHAIVRLGNPVNLKERFNAYKQDKARTVEVLTQEVQQVVQKNLDAINHC